MKVEPAVGTQNRIVLDILRMRPLCQSEIYRTSGVTHRLAARVHDLRNKFGWTITSEPCKMHDHQSQMVVYRLVGADQMEFHLG